MRAAMVQRVSLPIFLFLGCALCGRDAAAQGQLQTLDKGISQIAEALSGYLDSSGEKSVSVGEFGGPPLSSAGLEIKRLLRQALSRSGRHSPNARVQIRGRFRFEANSDGSDAMRIEPALIDWTGREIGEFSRRCGSAMVTNHEDMIRLVGASAMFFTPGRLGSDAPQKRSDPVLESLRRPEVALHSEPGRAPDQEKTIAAATPQSPYRIGVHVLNSSTGKPEPRPLNSEGGLAFAAIAIGEEYRIRVMNEADHDVGVKIFIDGQSIFEHSEVAAYRQLGMVWVGRKNSETIEGWHLSDEESVRFRTSDVPGTSPPKLKRETTDVGVITAVFYIAGTSDDVDRLDPAGRARSGTLVGTAAGEKLRRLFANQQVQFGITPISAVSVRYAIPPLPEN